MLAAVADAPLGHGHLPRWRDLGLRSPALPPPLRPDERGEAEREDDDRDVGVQPEPEELVGGVDAKKLEEEAAERVPDDVQAEEAGRADA